MKYLKYILILFALAVMVTFLAGCSSNTQNYNINAVQESQTIEISLGADSGAESPGTMGNDSTVGTVAWSNPDNAKASDGNDATVYLEDQISSYLAATNFGFSIPSGATIDGIKVEIEESTGTDAGDESSIKIIKGGTISGDEKSTGAQLPSLDTYIEYGGSSDLWGETWAYTDINSSTFGVGFSVTIYEGTVSVDHIRITVYYTAGASDTCTYSGSGDWYIDSSDNCYINTDVYVPGSVNLLNRGEGALHIIDDAELSVQAINSTSTDIEVEAGSKINFF